MILLPGSSALGNPLLSAAISARPVALALAIVVKASGYAANMDDARATEIIRSECFTAALELTIKEKTETGRTDAREVNARRRKLLSRMAKLLEEFEDERHQIDHSREKLGTEGEDEDLLMLSEVIQSLQASTSMLGDLVSRRGEVLRSQGGHHRPMEAEFVRGMRRAWAHITGQKAPRAGMRLSAFAAEVWRVYFGEGERDLQGWLKGKFENIP